MKGLKSWVDERKLKKKNSDLSLSNSSRRNANHYKQLSKKSNMNTNLKTGVNISRSGISNPSSEVSICVIFV